jgi:S-formylglutathione hydrolase FrmB
MSRVRGVLGAALVVALLSIGLGAAPAARASTTPSRLVTIRIPARSGEVPPQWLNYTGGPRANVLLPAGYDPHRQYPLLVALHGAGSSYTWWAQTGLTKLFADLDAIVVMPEGGTGWYTDWWNDGQRGDPSWESYFLDEVLPTVLERYPIRPERQYHAIAGISMGGLGAPYLGGRLPGFFGSVASISGFVDPQWMALLAAPGMGFFSFSVLRGEYDLSPVEGPPNGFYMAGHNPTNLVTNLAQTRIFVTSGNGDPTRIAPYNVPGSLAEQQIIYPMNKLFHAALTKAGIAHTYLVQAGGHDLPSFANEVRAMLRWGLFKPVPTNPTSWVNHTVATSGHLWDVSYSFTRPPDRVVELRRDGSTLTIGPAGADVTLLTDGGCVLRTHTPSRVTIPARCAS